MEDELRNIYNDNTGYCKACMGCRELKEDGFGNFGVKDVTSKEGMLIPTPRVRYANLDPSLTRHFDTLTSTDRRINQAADWINGAKKERISETKDSQLKYLNLISQSKEDNEIGKHPEKPKAVLSKFANKNGGPRFYFGKEFITASSDSYKNAMQGANLINHGERPQSITSTDFLPKVLYPLGPSQKKPSSLEKENDLWKKYRKSVSLFSDIDVPKRYGYYKFMDDPKPTV